MYIGIKKQSALFSLFIVMGAVLLLLFLIMIPRSAASIEGEGAQNFVQSMGDEVVRSISDPEKSAAHKKQELKIILEDRFDTQAIGRFALGRYWKDLTPDQQEEYLTLYENLVVSMYARRFSDYQGEIFKVSGVIPMGASDFIVRSLIIRKSEQNISVEWRVRMKDDQYKIIDVSVEGVSMIITHKADFASTIQREGGKAAVIIDRLREKTKQQE